VAAEPGKTIQANAFRLLQAMEEATRDSSRPVYLGDLQNLGMNEEEAKASYHYLRGKGLIETNFKLAFAARVGAAGHDAIRDAQRSPDQTTRAFPAITYNYSLNVETMTGSNIQQGTTNSLITASQTITTEQLKARDALKVLTEVVLNDTSISDTQKNELLDQITFLSEQSVASAKDRKPGLIKATFSALTEGAHTVTSMAGAWQVAEPILRSLFG
jgi:hypothetical protein